MMHVTRFGGNATALPGVAPDDLLDAARTIHLRRQLAAAVDHGTALLAALGLPRLVTPDFVPLDPVAIGEAVEAAVAALDALDGDADAEPFLGWTGAAIGAAVLGDTLDREAEDLDEFTLGWSGVSQLRLSACEDGFDPLDRGEAAVDDGPQDDDELDDDGLSRAEGDHADDEPTLGAPAGDGDQERWVQGSTMSNDPEDDDADTEPENGVAALWVFGPSRREVAHA